MNWGYSAKIFKCEYRKPVRWHGVDQEFLTRRDKCCKVHAQGQLHSNNYLFPATVILYADSCLRWSCLRWVSSIGNETKQRTERDRQRAATIAYYAIYLSCPKNQNSFTKESVSVRPPVHHLYRVNPHGHLVLTPLHESTRLFNPVSQCLQPRTLPTAWFIFSESATAF